MPIHLSSVSRRVFLRRTLLGGAGLLAAPSLQAASRAADPHSWALLADTHIAADRARVQQGVCMAAHFEAATGQILELPRRPAGVLIAGDLALSIGEAGDYATLRQLMHPLRAGQVPVHMALGNHDHREHFLDALTETNAAQRPEVSHVVAVVPGWRANWFLLDSLEKTLATPGFLGETQLAWLANALDAHADKPAIVVLHHNPDIKNGVPGVKDAAELFNVIRPRRQVKACVFGHTHLWRTWEDESGIHCINLPPVAYVFQPASPSGWVQATLGRKGMRLKLHCVKVDHPANGQTRDFAWRKA